MLHFRTNIKRGHRLQKFNRTARTYCHFCVLDDNETIIEETATMRVIINKNPYDHFEAIPVVMHYMLVPKKHRKSISEFTDREKLEYATLLGKYEKTEFSVYSRSVLNVQRSVEHVHTHLLLLRGPRVSKIFFLDKPYFLFLGKQRKQRTH